jgi:protein-glutamine gamma-glutamyltransferase
VSVRRSPPGQYVLGAPRGSGTALVQEIYLEPLGTDLLFVAPNLLHLELPSDRIVVDDMGSVSVGSGPARLHYIAISEVGDAGRGVLATGPDRLGPEERRRYLQLPPLAARIENLARQVGGAPREPYEMARRLSQYLSSEFEYTLTLTRRTTLDPLEEFLFVRRSGNCEYFAAALAVMLRSQGIPARVVGGFQQGEWNAYGHYFMVRLRDAHAWVEAHVDGVGWVTFDPSPRRVPLTPGAIALYLDALRMRWYRYVINWSLRDQIEVAALIRHHASGWRPGTAALREWEAPRPSPLLLAPLAAAVVVALGLWRLASRRRPGVGRGRLPWFYARALSVLAGRGLQPWPGETAREFCARAGAALPGVAAPLARITAEYERCRFGGRPPGPTETAAINRWLGVLARDDLPSQGGSSAR